MVTDFQGLTVLSWKNAIKLVLGAAMLWGCAVNPSPLDTADRAPIELPEQVRMETEMPAGEKEPQVAADSAELADVLQVSANGQPAAYTFNVEIASPDTGCEQYADWWEVLSEDGRLLYRRILTHSHVNEQPFARSGSPVEIGADTIVIVRAHMHPGGYGGTALRGSVQDGFTETGLEAGFAGELERSEPLPEGCAF